MKVINTLLLLSLAGFVWTFTPLQLMVRSRAVASSLIERVNTDILADNLLLKDLMQYKFNANNDLAYSSLILFVLYLRSKLKEEKLEDIDAFKATKKSVNSVLFLFIIFFTKNIESVS